MLRRHVLIFHSGALGDFVVSWPLALALGRMSPQSRIVYVTHASKAALAQRVLRTESADLDTGGWHHLHGDPGGLPGAARKLLDSAHTILSFVADAGDPWCFNVKAINSEAQLVTLPPRPPEGDPFPGHISQWIENGLAGMPAMRTAYQQILRSVTARGAGYKRSPDGGIAVHPGSGSDKKNWPVKHYIQLTRKLVKARHHVRVILGPAELERISAEDIGHFEAVAEVIRPRDYLELLIPLSISDALVCNDTGPGHLAGIIGTPTFALFGPVSRAARWKPLGPHVHVKEHPDLPHLGVDEVYKWVSETI